MCICALSLGVCVVHPIGIILGASGAPLGSLWVPRELHLNASGPCPLCLASGLVCGLVSIHVCAAGHVNGPVYVPVYGCLWACLRVPLGMFGCLWASVLCVWPLGLFMGLPAHLGASGYACGLVFLCVCWFLCLYVKPLASHRLLIQRVSGTVAARPEATGYSFSYSIHRLP